MKIDAMMRDIRVISLDQIKLDQENVRFGNDVAQNQREAIKLMLSNPEEAKKILRLAEHIVENGLDPTELQLVTPDEDGNFIVLEGNRRLTALKLLQRPDLCPADRDYKGFLKAHHSLTDGVPESLQCSVVPTRADGDVWIELKHTGENRGAGRVGWDSDIRDERRARQTGIESIGRQIRNLIVDNQHIFTNKAALDVFEIDVTTLTRIFSSTLGQNADSFAAGADSKLSLQATFFGSLRASAVVSGWSHYANTSDEISVDAVCSSDPLSEKPHPDSTHPRLAQRRASVCRLELSSSARYPT